MKKLNTYAKTSNKNLNTAMTVEEWNVVDYVAFESETSVIYPFATEFNDITMEMVDNIIELCNGHYDTDTLYCNCEKILGENPELEKYK